MLLDETNDLTVANGSIKLGDIRPQIAELVLTATPGEFKEVPTVGGNVRSMAGGVSDPFWASAMKKQVEAMGVEVENLYESNGCVELIIKE